MESHSESAGTPDSVTSSLATLGEELIPGTDALSALEAAQTDAVKLTQSLGVQIGADESFEAALSTLRSVRARPGSPAGLDVHTGRELQRSLATWMRDQTLEGFRLNFGQIQRQFADFAASWQRIQSALGDRLRAAVATVDWDAVRAAMTAMRERVDQRDLVSAFRTATLLPSPSMPPDLTEHVLELYRGGAGASPISNVVSGRYSRSEWILLNEITRDWPSIPYLNSRVKLMEQSRAAMRGKLYLLVAPALVPQIEGISADFLRGATGSSKASHHSLSKKLGEAIPSHVAVQVGTAAVDGFLRLLEEEFFAFVDFEQPSHRGPGFNRHILLHGRDFKQATRMNGVRAFILLDVLGAVVRHSEFSPTAVPRSIDARPRRR